MFQDREKRQKLKNVLMVITGALAAVFLILLIYGFFSIRPQSIEKASKLGQYYEFSSSSLPTKGNTIQKDISNTHITNSDGVEDSEIIGTIDEPNKNNLPNVHTKGRIAILVSNLGLNHLSTELALSLPREISLGFMPYTTSLKSFLLRAHQDGHEIFMYLPFETIRYPDDSPGQLPILASLSDEENIQRMNTLLHPFDGYVGVYGTPNEVFTNNATKIGMILNELAGKKLKLLISNGVIPTGEVDNAIISAKVIIDTEPNIPAIKKQLDTLVEIAKSGRTAIGFAGSYPVTIYTIKAWLPTLEAMGVEIVPITEAAIGEVKL